MVNMHRRAVQEVEVSQQALQHPQSQLALDQMVQEAEARAQNLQHLVEEANNQMENLQQRLQEAQRRIEEAERRVHDAKPLWQVHRDEFTLTDEILGSGAWGEVKVATFRGARIAAKYLHGVINYPYWQNVLKREINMAAEVRHPNLLQFIGASLDEELTILTELLPTSLRAVLEKSREPLPHQQICTIGLDIARALNYLHLMRPDPLVHRDISSANVLLEPQQDNSWKAKVCDYGSVNLLQKLQTAGPGNAVYQAPEAINPSLQSPKMDIFSFGVLLVEMCTATFPKVADRERLIQSIQQADIVALIQKCLAEDRDTRPPASEIIIELSKPHN